VNQASQISGAGSDGENGHVGPKLYDGQAVPR
jgi:hypothetical protein